MGEKRQRRISAKSALGKLARKLAVETDYVSAARKRIFIAPDVIRAVIAAMGYKVESDEDASELLRRLENDEKAALLPPVMVIREDLQPARIPVNISAENQRYEWRVIREDGAVSETGSFEVGRPASHVQRSASFRSRPRWISPKVRLGCGYHSVEINGQSMSLIVTPGRCWLDPIENGKRIWGVAAQLYLLKSRHNWGIGDFTDLAFLIDIAARWGASVIGLNPLHALFVDEPEHASPYAPASRVFLNILNIDVTAILEFETCEEAKKLAASEDFASRLETARAADMVNYSAVADLKVRILRLVHSWFVHNAAPERKRAFEDFVRQSADSLRLFCIFQAIRLDLVRKNRPVNELKEWPEELRTAYSPGVEEFAAKHRGDVDFFLWTQWIADFQLSQAGSRAFAKQMTVGLYRDLAVGSAAAGAEVWSNPGIVVAGANAGAPPDILNPAGQNWGLPPFNPRVLRESRYAPFIELVRANMRYSGALRIDHVVGLQHLYWVPTGHSPDKGAYVSYPFEELAGILALESQRNHCLVIGEDLGTVPPGFSDKLSQHGILSYRVLYFEQDTESGNFIPPGRYRRLALATVGSHDLATLQGWWLGDDIDIREQRKLYPDANEAASQRATRDTEKLELLAALKREGLDPGDGGDFDRLSRAVHTFLARCASAIAMIQLENLTGEQSQTNLPGTSTEYPNWRRRISKPLETLAEYPPVLAIVEAFRQGRSGD